jgi:hypothetical protein
MNRSTVHKLPLEVVIEVKRRLRSGSFDQLEIVSWLDGLGHSISKSALGRFAVKLREDDKALGMDREIMAAQVADVAALFEELAHLKAREAEILAQLKTLILPQ